MIFGGVSGRYYPNTPPLRIPSVYYGSVHVPHTDNRAPGGAMLDNINLLMKRFNPFHVTFSYKDYCELLNEELCCKKWSAKGFEKYEPIFKFLTTMKKDFFYRSEWFYFISQLMFGARIGEVPKMYLQVKKSKLIANIRSEKGSMDRTVIFKSSSPFVALLIEFMDNKPQVLTYKNYYRALLNANPNFFIRFKSNHLTATHIIRHFAVQTMYFVLKASREKIAKFMGWYHVNTSKAYTDKKLFFPGGS